MTLGEQQCSYLISNGHRTLSLPQETHEPSPVYLLGDQKNQTLQLAQNHYDAESYQGYGQQNTIPSSACSTLFAYDREYQDAATQLLYLKTRDYQPNHQHFLTMDSYPVWNKYNFADADPINNSDPTGHMSQLVSGVFLTLSALGAVPTLYDSVSMVIGKKSFSWISMALNMLNIGNTGFTVSKDAGVKVHNNALIMVTSVASAFGFLHGVYRLRKLSVGMKQVYQRGVQTFENIENHLALFQEVLPRLKANEPELNRLEEIKEMVEEGSDIEDASSNNSFYRYEPDQTAAEQEAIKNRIITRAFTHGFDDAQSDHRNNIDSNGAAALSLYAFSNRKIELDRQVTLLNNGNENLLFYYFQAGYDAYNTHYRPS